MASLYKCIDHDHVIPPLPVRQWVRSVPKRLRWYLEREPQALSAVLRIVMRVIAAHRRQGRSAGPSARCGAVSVIHRFGSSLNRHLHYHCCIIDGVFEPLEATGDVPDAVRFRPAGELTPEVLAALTEAVRVLRWLARHGLIEPEDVREMLAWENSGLSLDAEVPNVRSGLAQRTAPAGSGGCVIVPARHSPSSGLS